jgi:hypothetical protein
MLPGHSNSCIYRDVMPCWRYSLYVQDHNAGTWSRFFSSHTLDCCVDMLLYLDRRMPEQLMLRREMYGMPYSKLLN